MASNKNQGGDWQRRQEFGGVAEQERGRGGVAGTVAGAASSVASAAEQAWESTSHGAQQAASAVARTTEDAWDSLRSCMSRYPLAVFGAGVAVGVLAAMAWQRR